MERNLTDLEVSPKPKFQNLDPKLYFRIFGMGKYPGYFLLTMKI